MERLRRFIFNKTEASALHYAIVVSIIISMLLAFFIIRLDLNNQLKSQLHHKELLLYKTQNDILSKVNDSITQVDFLGAYPLIHSTKTHTKDTIRESFLLDYTHLLDTINLYITNQTKNTVISGNSHLNGNIQIANATITSGYVAGESYSGPLPYVKGSIKKSKKTLPALHPNFIKKTQTYYHFKEPLFSYWSSVLDSLGVSFKKPRLHIFSENSIYIRNKILKGNLRIHSLDKIELDQKNTIQDILLTAPEVVIKKGFKGRIHIIAKKIVIEKGVSLENPSSLIVFTQEDSTTKNSIHIKEKSIIKGKIIFYRNSSYKGPIQTPDIVVDEKSIVLGNIYAKGTLEFKGTLYGQILTDHIYLKKGGKTYINHLYNFNINPFLKESTSLPLQNALTKPLKWMY